MTEPSSRPPIYLKLSCPHCLKLLIFLVEAGLADRFEQIVFEQGDAVHRQLRSRMEEAGVKPSFPAVEFTPGKFETESDELIAKFAGEAGVDPATLPLLRYYVEGQYKRHGEMFRELLELRAAQPA